MSQWPGHTPGQLTRMSTGGTQVSVFLKKDPRRFNYGAMVENHCPKLCGCWEWHLETLAQTGFLCAREVLPQSSIHLATCLSTQLSIRPANCSSIHYSRSKYLLSLYRASLYSRHWRYNSKQNEQNLLTPACHFIWTEKDIRAKSWVGMSNVASFVRMRKLKRTKCQPN